LNKLCQAISKSTKAPIKRDWTSDYCDRPLPDSPIKRKPDIILKDIDNSIVTWRTVCAIAEITFIGYEAGKLVSTVIDKSYIIMTTQADHVFVPILSVWGKHKFHLTVTDREGQLRSMVYELAGVRPVTVSLSFLRVIVGLCFTDKQYVGYDPTMTTDVFGIVKSIKCCGADYRVVRTIYETQSFIGRATRVWQVEYMGKQYILKDAWVEKSRPVSEFEHLQHIDGVQGVPKFVCGEDVLIDRKKMCTGNIRGVELDSRRMQRRVVTASIGASIASFRTKRELISAFKDVVISALNNFSTYMFY
jgi:hypothetical protein